SLVGTGAIRAASSYGSFAVSGKVAVTSTVNHAPLACFSVGATSGTAGITTFTFDASCSSDPEDGSGAGSALQVRWDFTGDGVWDTGFSTAKTTSIVYPSAGAFTVTAELRDSGGYSAFAAHAVFVFASGAEVLVTTVTDEADA